MKAKNFLKYTCLAITVILVWTPCILNITKLRTTVEEPVVTPLPTPNLESVVTNYRITYILHTNEKDYDCVEIGYQGLFLKSNDGGESYRLDQSATPSALRLYLSPNYSIYNGFIEIINFEVGIIDKKVPFLEFQIKIQTPTPAETPVPEV